MDDEADADRRALELRRLHLPDTPIETWTSEEIDTLVTGFRPSAPPQVRAANTAVGVGDAVGRVVMAAILGLGILIVLAVIVEPWLWIAVGAWAACIIATVVWMLRGRRTPPRPKALTAIPSGPSERR